MEKDVGFQAALDEAKKGASQGGVPIGACLVSADGKILGRGHNMRIQKSSPTIHVRAATDLFKFQSVVVVTDNRSGRDCSTRRRGQTACLGIQRRNHVYHIISV